MYRYGMDKVMPLRETRDSLGQRVDAAHFADEITVITRNGEARAVIVSYESYQNLRGATVGQTSVDHARITSDTTGTDTVDGQAKQRSSSDHVGPRRKN